MPRRRPSGPRSIYRTPRLTQHHTAPPQAPAQPRRRRVPEWVWRDGFVALLVAAIVSATTIVVQYRIDEDRAARELRAANLSFVRDKASRDTEASKPFNYLDLSNQNMNGLRLSGADFTGANLDGSRLVNALLDSANFKDASLRGANMFRVNLFGSNMLFSDMSEAQLGTADMPGGLILTKMRDADLFGAYMPDGANLSGSDLRGANLEGVSLSSAILAARDVGGADLSGANLTDADLSNAILGDTKKAAANEDLQAAVNLIKSDYSPETLDLTRDGFSASFPHQDSFLPGAKIVDICYTSETKWPAGFNPPPSNQYTCDKFKTPLDRLVEEIESSFSSG